MAEFIPGLDLSRLFFEEWVQPVLAARFPGLAYDAAVIGSGSEVLGFDTPLSRDHHWGPRVTLFVADDSLEQSVEPIREIFRRQLPYTFRGYPTSFEEIPGEPGILRFQPKTSGPVNHRIDVTTVRRFMQEYLAFDWQRDAAIEPADWLTFPQQKLRTLVAGAVYHAGLGDVTALRQHFAWYPHDVWLYLLAAGWIRISQEESFVGRSGDVGDDLGSRLIAARLVRDVMQLSFLMERQYAPYSKWLGTAFAQLADSDRLSPILGAVLSAKDWRTREQHLTMAYQVIAEAHNTLGITGRLPTDIACFHERPYRVIHAERFAEAIAAQIEDEAVRRIVWSWSRWIGSLDQFSDSTDLREAAPLRLRLKSLYDPNG